MKWTRCLSVLAVIGALALAGCGGSSTTTTKSAATSTAPAKTSSSPSGTASSHALASRLSALCQAANTAFAAAPNGKEAAAIIAKFVIHVRSLKVPPQLQPTFSQYLSVIMKELKALEHGNQKAVFQLAHSKAKPLARKLGATGCVTSS